MADEFMTEPEVAKLLRCSTSKVKRLRFAGKLAYAAGRPVLISSADLQTYLDSVKVLALTSNSPARAIDTAAAAEAAENARTAFEKYKARTALKAARSK